MAGLRSTVALDRVAAVSCAAVPSTHEPKVEKPSSSGAYPIGRWRGMRILVTLGFGLWLVVSAGVLLAQGDGAGLEAAWPGISARLGLFDAPASEQP